jgi:pimeloyl-ACP methyl ester carboxylesterase
VRIEAPALIIHGECDGSVKPSEEVRLRDMLAEARIRVLNDCGHCPNYEYPRE